MWIFETSGEIVRLQRLFLNELKLELNKMQTVTVLFVFIRLIAVPAFLAEKPETVD